MRSRHRLASIGAVGAVGAVIVVGGVSTAAAARDDGPSSLVEDFSYPGADAITNVKLISGDGHIVYADCATTPVNGIGVLKVHTSQNLGDVVCFKILAATGLLNLELPGVYEIRGDGQTSDSGHEVTATVLPEGGSAVRVECDPNSSTPVGKGIDENDPATTLLKLEVHGQL